MRDRALTADEQVLARATKLAVQAAGGLEVCARETGLSTSQLSRCCSPNTPDSIAVRDAVTIESIGHGVAGHPHILRAMARLLGFVLVPLPQALGDSSGAAASVMRLTAELGDVANCICAALADDGEIDAPEAERGLLQLGELDAASAGLRLLLEACRTADAKTKRAKRT